MAAHKPSGIGTINRSFKYTRSIFESNVSEYINRRGKTFPASECANSFIVRRKAAAMSLRPMFQDKYLEDNKEIYWGNEVFAKLCGINLYSYNACGDANTLLAAAIWILDRIKAAGKMEELMPLLVRSRILYGDVDMIDIWDPEHDKFVINSVLAILMYRHAGLYKKVDSELDLERVQRSLFVDEFTAKGNQHQDVETRRLYDRVISLVPKEDIESAVAIYGRQFDILMDAAVVCGKAFVEILDRYEKRLKKWSDEFEQFKEKQKQSVISFTNAPRTKEEKMRAMEQFIKNERAIGARQPFSAQNNIHDSLVEINRLRQEESELSDLLKAYNESFFFIFCNFLGGTYDSFEDLMLDLEQKCNGKFDRRLYHAIENIYPDLRYDPYSTCFACFYLLDNNDDRAWIYSLSVAILNRAANNLPWANIEDAEEKEKGTPDTFSSDHIAPSIDWYRRRRPDGMKHEGTDYSQSPAQMIYEKTHCLLPRDMKAITGAHDLLLLYGINGQKAGAILGVMSVLHAAKNHSNASGLFKSDESKQLLKEYDKDLYARLVGEQEQEGPSQDELLDRIESLSKQLSDLQKENKKLKGDIAVADRARRDALNLVNEANSSNAEINRQLSDLRNYLFNQENTKQEEDDSSDNDDIFPYAPKQRISIFGGHPTWVLKLRNYLTGSNVRYISSDATGFENIIRNSDVVWIQCNAISHPQYWKIIDEAKLRNVPIRYFQYASSKMCAKQIVESEK